MTPPGTSQAPTEQENDSATGKFTAPEKAEPDLVEEAEKIKALLSAFGRLNDKNH